MAEVGQLGESAFWLKKLGQQRRRKVESNVYYSDLGLVYERLAWLAHRVDVLEAAAKEAARG